MSPDESIAEALAVEIQRLSPAAPPTRSVARMRPRSGLTPAEVKVLRQLASGRTTREIAETLVVATSTVDRHLTHIYTKLGVRNRAAATSFAVKHGLV